YDNRIEQRREDRSMDNTKLVKLKVGPLHSLENYIDALQSLTNIGEARTYLENQILVAPIDHPGQLNRGDSSGVPCQSVATNSKYSFPLLGYSIDVKALPMGWNTMHPPRTDKYCDLENCTRTDEDYLISGIEKNCKAYDESVNSTKKAKKVIDKGNSNVPETTETTTHTSAVEVDNVVLNSNIDQLYSNAMNNFRAAL
ncbi:8618_t:CDS:2, partial [Gigaspora rosea]